MKHPKSEDVFKLVETFKSVLPLATREDHLNMMQGSVNNRYECGTVHCHGGWYAIAKNLHKNQTIDFVSGMIQMRIDLGFENDDYYRELIRWASGNPEIWGNNHGDDMFGNRMAFYHEQKRPKGAQNLQHIIDHWTEVGERLKALEDQQNRVDITKELAVLPAEETLDSKLIKNELTTIS